MQKTKNGFRPYRKSEEIVVIGLLLANRIGNRTDQKGVSVCELDYLFRKKSDVVLYEKNLSVNSLYYRLKNLGTSYERSPALVRRIKEDGERAKYYLTDFGVSIARELYRGCDTRKVKIELLNPVGGGCYEFDGSSV